MIIDGVPLPKVQMSDYYRRFLIVKQILVRSQSMENSLKDDYAQYVQFYKEMNELQNQVSKNNQKYSLKNYQFNLTLDSLSVDQRKYIDILKQKRDLYQNELMKRWRAIINQKQSNYQASIKEKERKGTSNKNLMFLTSEILKKERVNRHKLQEFESKIIACSNKIEQDIEKSLQMLKKSSEDIKSLMIDGKVKEQKMLTGLKLRFNQERQRLQQNHLLLQKQIQNKLQKQKKQQRNTTQMLDNIVTQLFIKVKNE